MNLSSGADHSLTCKENIPPSSKAPQVQRGKQRVVLGVLSENEQHGHSVSQGSPISRSSSFSDSSQHAFFGYLSSLGHDMYVEEACEVVLAASGEEVVSGSLDSESDALQNENLKLLQDLSPSLSQDVSMRPGDCVTSQVALHVSEYAEDIHRHLREREVRFRPRPAYLENHSEITSSMRVVLLDWLVEVTHEYRLCSETLHLAVNYVDRFLSRTKCVMRAQLQLVGTVALMTAAKFEEICPPELNDFVNVTDCTYTKEQVMHMEHVLLDVLAFELAAPTTNQFLHMFMSIHNVCTITENLALYIADLSLLEIDLLLNFTPSMIAAGAYSLANCTVNKSLWPDSLHALTGYATDDIMSCLIDLHKLYVSAETCPQQAIREKYKSSRYFRVSLITPPADVTYSQIATLPFF